MLVYKKSIRNIKRTQTVQSCVHINSMVGNNLSIASLFIMIITKSKNKFRYRNGVPRARMHAVKFKLLFQDKSIFYLPFA